MPTKDFDRPFCVILVMTVTRFTENKNTYTVAIILVEKIIKRFFLYSAKEKLICKMCSLILLP